MLDDFSLLRHLKICYEIYRIAKCKKTVLYFSLQHNSLQHKIKSSFKITAPFVHMEANRPLLTFFSVKRSAEKIPAMKN